MNNSFLNLDLAEEKPVDTSPRLRERETEVVKIIESLNEISGTKEWSTLKKYIFDGLVERLEKELKAEARKDGPDSNKLGKLSGQLLWAERYATLDKLIVQFRTELTNIRLQLHGRSERNG